MSFYTYIYADICVYLLYICMLAPSQKGPGSKATRCTD